MFKGCVPNVLTYLFPQNSGWSFDHPRYKVGPTLPAGQNRREKKNVVLDTVLETFPDFFTFRKQKEL